MRQLFVVARGSSDAATFSALGCGIEYVDELSDERVTSIVELSGSPASVFTTERVRIDRRRASEDERFEIELEISDGVVTCSVRIDNETTTAVIGDATVEPGRVGFYTREREALFENVEVCGVRE